ncbi:hypothetical protein L484_019705 [Morus notabilis]|uniref:PWWP domain-containing protein n=1 Tax=Morus notabilis TaxID=981085 RepID=W9QDJ1_9ROSA|nr:uncharacterized protein At1g51745 isoform X2 [Morus notabilis]EXB29180.1 hypothetical protein L484_019705 [Morus notabilis]
MGSTDSGTAAEFSVGSIVWVRRRNGSWWPGKIVGPEELSASHLTSPRSGTPVKLLGREDASVDWYNLEKSKRVKAFRCGEFDDCIERAESSQGMPIKKREKYARREDAILHALELEKQQMKKQGKLGIASDCANSKSSGAVKKGLVTPSESFGNDNLKLGNSKSNQFYKRLDVSPKNEILGSPLSSQKSKEGNQLSGEEDHSEVIPRMRGLQDFGLRIAPSKTKLSPPISTNGSGKPLVDNSVQALSSGVLKMGSTTTSQVNGKNSLDKRKRLHEGLSEECLVKRRDKRRPLVQVLKSSAKLEVPHSLQPDSATVSTSISGVEPMGVICRAKRSRFVYIPESSESLDYKAMSQSQSDIEMSDSQIGASLHPNSLEGIISGSTEDESDTSETDTSESESDSSETEDMDEEMAILSDAAVPTEPEVSSMGRYDAQEHGSMGGLEPDEPTLSGDMSHFYGHYPSSTNEAVSKWQLKGKRNIRNLTKRPADATDWKGYIYGAYPDEKDFRAEMIELDNGYSSSRAAFRGRSSVGRSMIDWDDSSWEDQPSLRGYWDTKREHFDPVYDSRYQFGGRSRSMLMDVDLKVQASYQKEPVPIVSLMSKLNGKAIIGHPIQIETLEDGSSSNLLPTMDYFGNEAIENDGSTALPQAWRTARRTANFRVPRPHLSSALDGDEAAYDFPFLDRETKPPSKKSNAGNFSHKPVLVRKNALHNSGPLSDRKNKKVPKKVSSSSSQKTRTLSSIAIEHNLSNKPTTHDSSSNQIDGLIKPESSVPPTTVACIPVKLVFSRLLEKINRPPSKAAASNGALLNSDVERNPS